MLDRLNPFRKPRPNNPLDALSEDELRAARKKLEISRDRTLRQIRELEQQKLRLLEEGAQGDMRVRKDKAYQIKDCEEQIRQLDIQRDAIAKQVLFLNRLNFLQQNSQQVGQLVIDELLGKIDSGKLRNYVEEITVRGAAGSDRLQDLVEMFDQNWNNVAAQGDDPEITRILEEMERLSMPAWPDIPGRSVAQESDPNHEAGTRQSSASS